MRCASGIRATMAIMVATALHAIATGNMLPAFVTEANGSLRELTTICVDSSEFVVSKLKDRGTHQAFGVVTSTISCTSCGCTWNGSSTRAARTCAKAA
jgi:hypothetical protein